MNDQFASASAILYVVMGLTMRIQLNHSSEHPSSSIYIRFRARSSYAAHCRASQVSTACQAILTNTGATYFPFSNK